METYVWVDSWQQQCCGDDFGVGSTVEWSVAEHKGGFEWVTRLLGEEWGRGVEYSEEHHGSNELDLTLSGAVRSIRVVTCDRVLGTVEGPGPDLAMVPVPGSGRVREANVAERWEPEPHAENHSTSFDGWIVELEIEGSA